MTPTPPAVRTAVLVALAGLAAAVFTVLVSPLTGLPALAALAMTLDGPTEWWQVLVTAWFTVLLAAPFLPAFGLACRWLVRGPRPRDGVATTRAVSAASQDIRTTLEHVRPLLDDLRSSVDDASRATDEVERLVAL